MPFPAIDCESSRWRVWSEEIRKFCDGQIAHYKIPRYVVFVDSFPLTVTGKVQKSPCR